MDPGEVFLSDLIVGQHKQHALDQNEDCSHNAVLDDDARLFSIASANEEAERDIFGNIDSCSDDVSGTMIANKGAENTVEIDYLPILLD